MHVCTTVEQEGAQLSAFLLNSHVKRRVPPVVRMIHDTSSTSVEQEGTQFGVLFAYCHVKRCVTPVVRMMHTTSTSVEQEGTQFGVLFAYRHVKRRLHTRGTDNTGIKIQPTDTQVSVSHRGNKPIHIDGTTLLTQRVSSTHSQRRHSIDAAAFRKRENILLFHGTPAHLQAHLLAVHPLRQRRANSVLESGEAAAFFPHLHLHLRTSPRRRDVHCCVACVVAASFWMPRAVEGGGGNRSQTQRCEGKRRGAFSLVAIVVGGERKESRGALLHNGVSGKWWLVDWGGGGGLLKRRNGSNGAFFLARGTRFARCAAGRKTGRNRRSLFARRRHALTSTSSPSPAAATAAAPAVSPCGVGIGKLRQRLQRLQQPATAAAATATSRAARKGRWRSGKGKAAMAVKEPSCCRASSSRAGWSHGARRRCVERQDGKNAHDEERRDVEGEGGGGGEADNVE